MNYEHWLHSPILSAEEKADLARCSLEEQKQFETKIGFGTAGIRGLIGLGPHCLNRFTVRQSAKAFYQYLVQSFPKRLGQGIVIAYDNRHCSRLFAEEAASLFAYHQMPVHLYSDIRPTPMLSFAVRKLGALGGIMITASHNPPSDNGLKFYRSNGSQLLPPEAKAIENKMEQIGDVLTIPTLPYAHAKQLGKIVEISSDIDSKYYEHVLALTPCTNTYPSLKVVYTPLHGTGQNAIPAIFQKEAFLQLNLVQEQCQPDPNFPTVESPNPEHEDAFALAKKLAQEVKADIIIATDPDADRTGIMVPYLSEYIHPTGNQLGILLLYYLRTEQNKSGTVYSTIVSTALTKKIAVHFGIKAVETLTGFKYIAQQIEENQDLLLAFEESYGYLIGDFVRDKDGIQASLLLCHIVAHYKRLGKSLLDVLDEIYMQFGYHQSKVFSFPTDPANNIIDEFFSLWSDKADHQLLDYRMGIDSLPKAEVGKICLHDGSWMAIRPSGTEPKVKVYVETVGKNDEETEGKMKEMVKIISHLFDY